MQSSEPTGNRISLLSAGGGLNAETRRKRRLAENVFRGQGLIERWGFPRLPRPGVLLFPVFALVLFSGCATAPEHHVALTGNIMVDGPMMIANGPPRDRVLWQYRTAAAALRDGQFPLAKQLLDDALLTLGGIYGKDKAARQSRSYFHEEARKTFIGEPYERVMAYCYRGILYWMDGEPDNARACFRSAQLQDAGAENNKDSADYAILDYLDGLASTKLRGDGSDAFQRAVRESRLSRLPPYNPAANVLVLLEFGPGPVKYATGDYGEQLRFRVNPSPVHAAVITVAGQTVKAGPCDDLGFQATTRGGRVMDYVLGNKAVFKSTTSVVGDAAIISGAILASDRHRNSAADEVGVGLMIAGFVSKMFSAATTPAADTRAWDDLPRYLSFASLSLPAGPHTATIEFLDQAGNILPGLTKIITIHVPADGKDKIVFVSDKSATPQTV
jgi:hypothetical protein